MLLKMLALLFLYLSFSLCAKKHVKYAMMRLLAFALKSMNGKH